jgi:UDP-N-acetyl-D-mannosaminuronate dehydrogenase
MTAHQELKNFDIRSLVNEPGIVFDAKSVLKDEIVDSRL